MKIEVREIRSELTRKLRHQVLWPHISKEEECVIDIDDRPDAIHLGAFIEDRIVGVCSLFELSSPRLDYVKQYRLRVMATDPSVRGMGAGKAIVTYALELIKSKGYDVLWCDAREIALGFYKHMGFMTIDEWYNVKNIGLHKTMYFPF